VTWLWVIVWFVAGTPSVEPWNGWLLTLLVVAYLDLVAVLENI
jgi:hypothetical protein